MKMKKMFAVIFAFVLSMSLLAGCGKTEEETKVTPQDTAAVSESSAQEETAAASEAAQTETPEPAEEVTAESLLNGYFESVPDIDSMSFDLLMDVAMGMTLFGESTDVTMKMDVYTETYGDNAYMEGTMESESYGEKESQETKQYIMLEDGSYVTYSYDQETDSWEKYESDQPAVSKDLIPQIDTSGFALETVTENGDEQYKISGDVDLQKVIEQMGESFGEVFGSLSDIGVEDITGTAHVAYYFDIETKALENVHIDMADAFQEMFMSMFSAMLEGQDLGEEGTDLSEAVNVDVSSFELNLNNIVINEVKEIVLPEEAASAVETEDAEDLDGLDDLDDLSDEIGGEEEELSVELAESFDFKEEYLNVTYNGSELKIGEVKLSEFLAATGLEIDEDYRENTVEAGETDYAVAYLNDNYDSVSFYIRNDGEETAPINDCLVYGIDVAVLDDEVPDCSIAGFKIGATQEEVFAALGNPTYGYETDYVKSYNWDGENWDSLVFVIQPDTNIVSGIGVQSYNW